jgi:hypothetical protein
MTTRSPAKFVLFGLVAFLAGTAANADYWDYRYIGNPSTFVSTTNPNSAYARGHATVDFHSAALLGANQTFSLLSTPGISNVIVNFDHTGGLNPGISSTFNGYPTAMLDPYYSYVTIGENPGTVASWEIAKYFEPYSGLVLTAAYGPDTTFKPFCTYDCVGIDEFYLDTDHVWNYDRPGQWQVTFVPEPESTSMMLGALGVLAVLARRRKA